MTASIPIPRAWAAATASLLLLAGCLSSDDDGAAAPGDAFGLDATSATTVFAVRNATGAAVTVRLTLGPAVTGNWVRNVADFPSSWGVSGSGLVGQFTLPTQTTRSFTLPIGVGLSGNVMFGGGGGNPGCGAQPGFPNAANLGEFTLGVPGNGYIGQESVDISNVNGTNSYMALALAGSNPWNAGAGYPNVKAASNGNIGSNANRVGVFGWQATNCTSSVNPPNPLPGCPAPVNAPAAAELSSQPNCPLQRPTNGGVVTIVFNGFIPGSSN
jgi:hypothetical protein